MSSKYFPELVRIARDVMPSLQYDLQNASTTFSLQSACQRIFETLAVVLHHCILDAAETAQASAPPPAPETPKIQVQARPAPQPVVPVAPRFPTPQHAAISRSILSDVAALPPPATVAMPSSVAPPSVSPDMPVQAGVASVFITAQGTQAFSPSGVKTVLPPGEAVDLSATSGAAPELPYAPPGVEQIILPPGGGMSPELAAALASRTGEPPTT